MKTLSTTDAENILSAIVEYVKTPNAKSAKDALHKQIDVLKEAISDQKIEDEKIEWTRINNDSNGNPRYVCHFLNLLKDGEHGYDLALSRAKKIGGRKYNNKSYGGGIVFQSYNIQDDEKRIKALLDSLDDKKSVGSTTKSKSDDLILEIAGIGKITEKELKLLLKRKNAGEKFNDAPIWDGEVELSKDQTAKGLKWLRNLWKSPTGKERSTNPFGSREEAIIGDTNARMFLRGFYDAGNASHSWWIPLYEVSGDGTTMEYYVKGGKISIAG